jgi:hypothetical protein
MFQLRRFLDSKNSIESCESGDWVLPMYEKNRVQKSHATVPLNLISMH